MGVGAGWGGWAFFTFLKSCGLPEVSLGFPLLLLIPSRVPILPGRGELRAGVAPGQNLGCGWGIASCPTPGPSCSLSPLPLTPTLDPLASLQPLLVQSNPSWTPPSLPPLPTEEVACCPLPGTEDKNSQWKNTWLRVKH